MNALGFQVLSKHRCREFLSRVETGLAPFRRGEPRLYRSGLAG